MGWWEARHKLRGVSFCGAHQNDALIGLLNHSLRVASTRHRSNQAIKGRECSKKSVQQGPIREMSFVVRISRKNVLALTKYEIRFTKYDPKKRRWRLFSTFPHVWHEQSEKGVLAFRFGRIGATAQTHSQPIDLYANAM